MRKRAGIILSHEGKLALMERHKQGRRYFAFPGGVDGEFGAGTGEEYGEVNPFHRTYHPLWMPVEEILEKNVVPRGLAELTVKSYKEGWKDSAIIHEEPHRK
ncbi:MAG: hypothetical protein HXY38_06780 [Chloroflexi bacterium]|nr:hypothetical protein [Chloroflexota bacterium]